MARGVEKSNPIYRINVGEIIEWINLSFTSNSSVDGNDLSLKPRSSYSQNSRARLRRCKKFSVIDSPKFPVTDAERRSRTGYWNFKLNKRKIWTLVKQRNDVVEMVTRYSRKFFSKYECAAVGLGRVRETAFSAPRNRERMETGCSLRKDQ